MPPRRPRKQPRSSFFPYVFLAVGLAAYSALAYYLRFVQDDAFITYRYVANFLAGDGLVYNIGERICGFTNFGWTIYLSLVGALGQDIITVSRLTGFLLGGGVIWIACLTSRKLFTETDLVNVAFVALTLGANLSLAYWSPAGLETAAFACAVALSLYWFLTRSRLLAFGIALGVWLRPEGAVVAGLFIVIETVICRALPRLATRSTVLAFVLSLPYVLFMYFYYGSVLPNPFYAKTTFGLEQLRAGADYSWLFLRHYGYVGLPLILGLALWRRLTVIEKQLLMFVLGYIAYIIVIGGDVLKVHRFFVPILAPYALLTAGTLTVALRWVRPAIRVLTQTVVIVGALVWVIVAPWNYTHIYNNAEKALVSNMLALTDRMVEADSTNFTAAATTIGAFGYALHGHPVIDMLGLTDSTIARHPLPAVPGITTTWRESKHNSSYLLERAPDYIVFSTGMKASAPAEKVLLLYPDFLRAYRVITYPQPRNPETGIVMLDVAFRRVYPITHVDEHLLPADFVNAYTRGQQFFNSDQYDSALTWLERALVLQRELPAYPELHYQIAACKVGVGNDAIGYDLLNRVIAGDSLAYNAHLALYMTEMVRGDTAKAAIHRACIVRFNPSQLPYLDSSVSSYLSQSRPNR